MSRTDKDMPWWVRAGFWQPEHNACPHDRYLRYVRWDLRHECNLPAEPRVLNPRFACPRHYPLHRSQCYWYPVWRFRYAHRGYAGSWVPKWFIDHVWHNPERRRVRTDLGKLRQEYNANGDIEDYDFPCWQARRSAHWLWD